jgi:hypothetical protein
MKNHGTKERFGWLPQKKYIHFAVFLDKKIIPLANLVNPINIIIEKSHKYLYILCKTYNI